MFSSRDLKKSLIKWLYKFLALFISANTNKIEIKNRTYNLKICFWKIFYFSENLQVSKTDHVTFAVIGTFTKCIIWKY